MIHARKRWPLYITYIELVVVALGSLYLVIDWLFHGILSLDLVLVLLTAGYCSIMSREILQLPDLQQDDLSLWGSLQGLEGFSWVLWGLYL